MPTPLDPERHRKVSAKLDRALELEGAELSAWLAKLEDEDEALAGIVARMLERHRALSREGFLETQPIERPSLSGLRVGAYTLRSLIGQGGMGSVWLAERSDGRFHGVAAIKLLNASLVGQEGEARFRREGEILARLRHPHIASLIDAGVAPSGQPYLVLEHVDGIAIDQHCDENRLPVDARLRILLDVADAVAHAHKNLIVHRDLKPSNVLVGREGEVKLLDFGIAKLLEPNAAGGLTRDGASVLTPEFAAPEQLEGGPITTATDVFALGVLLYLLLAGRHPAAGSGEGSAARLIEAIVHIEPPRLSEAPAAHPGEGHQIAARRGTSWPKLRGLLRGDLENIAAKALKKQPSERYGSVAAFAEDLRHHLAHRPVSARPDSIFYRTSRFARRNRLSLALAGVALAALAAGLAGTVSQARRANEEARTAIAQRDFALRQLSRAEAINDLNSFLLSDAAPLGRPFTVGELLERAERVVERSDDPDESRVALLVSIGRQYALTENAEKARRVLARAYELSLEENDPAVRAEAACTLASAVAGAGESERAERLLREAEATLPSEPLFAFHRILCHLMGSEVAQDRGDAQLGLERAESAQRLLDETAFKSALLRFRVSTRVAESYRVAGRSREAATAFEEAFEELRKLGRDDTERAGTLLNNWGVSLYVLGQPREADRLFERAIGISSADGTEEGVSPMLLSNRGRALRDLGRLTEAARLAETAYARAVVGGRDVVVYQVLLLRASVYRLRGDLDRAQEMLSEVVPRLERLVPPTHVAFAAVALERALLYQARGEPDLAWDEMEHAVSIVEASGEREAYLSLFLLRRSELGLSLGRVQTALEDAREALRRDEQRVGSAGRSSILGHDYLALGGALQALGRTEEAGSALASAVEHLTFTLGSAHPATRRALALSRERNE